MEKNLKQKAKVELAKRELASRKLAHFTTYTKPDYEMIATQDGIGVHERIIEKLEAVERGDIKRLMIFIRPRIWKSELASKRFPTWFLWRNPDKEVVISSYSWDVASNFWRKGREIVQWQEYQNVFPSFKLSKDKSEAANWETVEWGGLYSVWVGGSLTSRGFDIGIIDDPVKDRQEAESPTMQDRIVDWYTSTFYTRRKSQDSAIILMMTRWNVNDLAGYLLEEEKNWGDKWEVLTIPAIDEQWNEIIWEWKWDEWYIKEEKSNVSAKDWAALYQQDPIASSSNIFRLENLRYFLMSDFEKAEGILKKDDLKTIIYVDPAFSSSNSSDDASVFALGKHKITRNYYQLDWYSDTSAPSVTFRAILSMYDRVQLDGYKIDAIYIEDVAINKEQSKFIEDFKTFLKENDRDIIVNSHKPKGKKEDRIKFILEPKTALNAIYLRKDHADPMLVKGIEREMLEFPNWKHDDKIDCLSGAIAVLDSRGEHNIQRVDKPMFHDKMKGKYSWPWSQQMNMQQNKSRFWL